MSNYTEGLIQTIEERYNPEADLPGPYSNPLVSITEYQLLEIIRDMRTEIAILQEERRALSIEVSSLNDRITDLEALHTAVSEEAPE
jgi:hypothetical protein